MANFHFEADAFDELEKIFDKLSNTNTDICKKAVNKAAPVLEKGIRKAFETKATGGYATGNTAKSFAPTNAKKNQYGVYSVVRPVGKNEKGVDYAKIAAIMEYGTQYRVAKPYMETAINSTRDKCEAVMQEVFSEEIDKITGG